MATKKTSKANKKVDKMSEVAGWYGATAIVLAYGLLSFGYVDANDFSYQLLNLSGAFGIIWISAVKNVMQSVALNSFWAIIAFVALVKIVA